MLRVPGLHVLSLSLPPSLHPSLPSSSCLGAGPHPKALSGRLVSAIWWLFSIVLLATYFSKVSAWLKSDQNHLSIQSFEDLAQQDLIEYGTLDGGSSLAFFKVNTTTGLYMTK